MTDKVTAFLAVSDRVSKNLSEVIRAEIDLASKNNETPDAAAIMAGQCISMLTYMSHAPKRSPPPEFTALEAALQAVLQAVTVVRCGGAYAENN